MHSNHLILTNWFNRIRILNKIYVFGTCLHKYMGQGSMFVGVDPHGMVWPPPHWGNHPPGLKPTGAGETTRQA